MTSDATAERLDRILRSLEGKIDNDAQWLEPNEIEALRELVEYREDIVREYRKRRARKLVIEDAKATYQKWKGAVLALAAGAALLSQLPDGGAEVLEWLSKFKK